MKRRRFALLLACLGLTLALCACGNGSAPAAAPAESDAGAAEPRAFDAGAYEAAAQSVRNEFTELIENGVEDFDEEAHPELPWYTAILTRVPENSYYEAFCDFDGNSVPEMLIGVGDERTKTPIAVYAFDGQSMRYLCKEAALGERARLSRADGLFIVTGSGGAADGTLTLYRIAPDGWSTEIVDVIDYHFSDAGQASYRSERGVVSAEELVERGLADAVGLDFEPEWSCFYPREGK